MPYRSTGWRIRIGRSLPDECVGLPGASGCSNERVFGKFSVEELGFSFGLLSSVIKYSSSSLNRNLSFVLSQTKWSTCLFTSLVTCGTKLTDNLSTQPFLSPHKMFD